MCRLRWTSSDMSRGASKSFEGVSVVGDGSVPSVVGESDCMESPVVMG